MTDNINVNEATTGTLAKMATDYVGDTHYPRYKVGFGSEGGYGDVSQANPLPVRQYPLGSHYRNLDLGNTGQVVKASAGVLYSLVIGNAHASAARFVKVYDKVTAAVAASDVPVATYRIPPNTTMAIELGQGIEMLAGIGLRASTGVGDADTGAPATNDVTVNAVYV